MTRKFAHDSLYKSQKLESSYMKNDCMHKDGQGKDLGTSRNLDVMVKLHMTSTDVIEILKGNFMSLQLVHFLIHLIMLVYD